MSVFVSWCGRDREVKNQVVRALREVLGPDEQIWDSDDECRSIFSEECMDGVTACEVFVFIMSDDSMRPTSYASNELTAARALSNLGKLDIVAYKITDQDHMLNAVGFQINHVSCVFGKEGPEKLARRVQSLLADRRAGKPARVQEKSRPVIEGTRLGRTAGFVENSRDDVFEDLDAAFARSNVVFAVEFDGYGRKSALREYFALHESEYDERIFLPFFSGSIRDFFLNGLPFLNVNERMFENLDEKQTILKKAEVLNLLDRRTVIVVPSVLIGQRDDQFIFDVLASIRCRIVFVTQSLPVRMRKAFPAVSIGRMADEYLLQLFFRCYDGAGPDEKAMLREPLLRFFDRVDGHTSTIELTATELDSEFGLYPEDIPEVLEKISQSGGDELPERIFRLISNLFDGQKFDESQQAVLYAAALVAVTPMDEKEFVQLLRDAGCYDAQALRTLAERKWLHADREKRLITMPSFLSEVCLSKIGQIDSILAAVCTSIDEQLRTAMVEMAPRKTYRSIMRARACFGRMDMNGFRQLYDLLLLGLEDDPDSDFSLHAAAEAAAREERDAQQDERVRAALDEHLAFIPPMIRTIARLQEVKKHQATGDLGDEYLSTIVDDLRAYAQVMEDMLERTENPVNRFLFGKLIKAFTADGKPSAHQVCADFLNLVEELSDDEQDASRYEFEEQFVLESLCETFINFFRGEKYLQLKLCKARLTLAGLFGGFNSGVSCFRNQHRYFDALINFECCDEELDATYEQLLELLEKVRGEEFPTEEAAVKFRSSLMYEYLQMLVKAGRIREAETVLRQSWELPLADEEMLFDRVNCIEKVVYAYLDRAQTEYAACLIDDVMALGDLERLHDCQEQELAGAAARKLEYLETLLDVMEKGSRGSSFDDGSAANRSYYQTYAADPSERRHTPRYASVAQAAQGYDYSALDTEGLRRKREELIARAASTPLLALAPEAFALVSEAGSRILGYRHHYVQYLGAAAIADGKIAEILNGEGKTYTIILAAFLHSLYGQQVHIADSSGYLCRRNYEWMRGVLELLGCRVGLMLTNKLDNRAYGYLAACDIIYSLADAEVFLFMEGESRADHADRLRYDVLICDEADQLMIERAMNSFGVSDNQSVSDDRSLLEKAYRVILLAQEEPGRYYESEKHRVHLTPEIYDLIGQVFGKPVTGMDRQTLSSIERMIRIGVVALEHHEKGKDYFIHEGRLVAEDRSSGLFTPVSSEYAFFYARKEQDDALYVPGNTSQKRWLNEINMYEVLRQFRVICGTTATAASMRGEFRSFYGMDVYRVPPNREIRRVEELGLVYFKKPAKYRAILDMVMEKHAAGQPILLVTENVPESRGVHSMLVRNGLPATLINAENADEEAQLMGEAGKLGRITVATAIANRGVDICLGGSPTRMAREHLLNAGEDPALVQHAISGLPHERTELIRRRYWDLVAIYQKQTERERLAVEALGGLCVIGTTCFSDMRVEQQMCGRAGRQGSPGESHTFYSLEDEPLQLFVNLSENALLKLFANMDEGLQAPSLDRVIRKARLRLQSRTYADIDRTKYTLYLRPERQRFFQLVRRVTDDRSLRSYLVEQLSEDPRHLKDLTDMKNGKPVREGSLTAALRELTPRFGLMATRRKAAEILADAFITQYGQTQNGVVIPLSDRLRIRMLGGAASKAWPDYLAALQKELDVKDQKYDQEKKRAQHLTQYARETGDRLYHSLLERVMLDCLNMAERSSDDPPMRRRRAGRGLN